MTRTRTRIARIATIAGALAGLTGFSLPGGTEPARAGYPECRASQLSVWRAEPGDSAAGSVYYQLEFSNTSSTTCTLHGYPDVAATDARGRRIGAPAARIDGAVPARFSLRQGATAHARLRIVDVANFPPSACQSRWTYALRILAPNVRQAALLDFRFGVCAQRTVVNLYVGPVGSGVGIPGYTP